MSDEQEVPNIVITTEDIAAAMQANPLLNLQVQIASLMRQVKEGEARIAELEVEQLR